jgi:hypothetical protein
MSHAQSWALCDSERWVVIPKGPLRTCLDLESQQTQHFSKRCHSRSVGQSKMLVGNTILKIARCSAQSYTGFQSVRIARNSFVRNFANKMGLPRVFFDMAADGNAVGRIVIEVS